ncbi:MAG: DoxX family protein [Campylobacteraceae bacterium]
MSTCPIFKSNSLDVGRLVLRILIGGGLLIYGISKLINGISGVKYLLTTNGLPEFFAYGVYLGEVVAPILILIGFKTRIASLFVAINMIFAIFLAFGFGFLSLNSNGGLVSETALFYGIGSIALMFLGAGKYSLDKN